MNIDKNDDDYSQNNSIEIDNAGTKNDSKKLMS